MLRNKTQTFNDGVVRIYKIMNYAPNGGKPTMLPMLRQSLRYAERTIGITRHYTALQVNSKVKYVLRCPLCRDVSAQDVAIPNDGVQYRVAFVQYPESIFPKVMDLTLEETSAKYEIAQTDITLSGGTFEPWTSNENEANGGGSDD